MKKIFYLLATLWLMQVSNSFAQNTIKEDVLIVAGGCFWCTESDFEKHPGVLHAESGYINGSTQNPTYNEVSSNQTGHFEAVKITYNKDLVTLRDLVDFYWYTIDPTDPNGQFCDKGSSYKTALFYQDEAQKAVFEDSLASIKLTKPFDEPIVTEILKAKKFYSAEAYHQDFYKKSSLRYRYYRHSCGREKRIEQLWGQIVTDKL
jgi:peptide-methionine (S)-S-oxide reductase